MELTEEYCLSEYQDLGTFNEKNTVHIVRNRIDGTICVKKYAAPETEAVYRFLKQHPDPHIPQIYLCVQTTQGLAVIEEYCTGKNLLEIAKEHRFTETETAQILTELARGLLPLHRAHPPVICRDLKAENVMVTGEGQVKIIDFDIARIYQPGKQKDTVMMGTAGYAAPEQFGFGQTDARTDIYALGVLCNFLLCGYFPLEKTAEGKLHDVIVKCTQMRPQDRYQNLEELLLELECLFSVDMKKETAEKELHTVSGKFAGENAAEHTKQVAQPDAGDENTDGYYSRNNSQMLEIERIPGFRTGKWWKMLVAVTGYLAVTSFCFSIDFTDVKEEFMRDIFRVIFWLIEIVYIFFVCDYRGMKRGAPLVNHSNRFVRLAGYMLAQMLAIICAAFWCSVISVIFH